MNINKLIISCTAVLLSANIAWAADGSEAELTIRLMGTAEAELPDAVTKEITLPEAVAEDSAAVEKAARGMDAANDNRQRRETGLLQADEARERGADMAGEAQDNRESRGRSEDRPDPPADPGRPGS